ncbi:hypothetical protein [Cupriavidus sp. a3]
MAGKNHVFVVSMLCAVLRLKLIERLTKPTPFSDMSGGCRAMMVRNIA